jgi:hypothetical protein
VASPRRTRPRGRASRDGRQWPAGVQRSERSASSVATPGASDAFLTFDAYRKTVKWQVAYCHRSLLNSLTGQPSTRHAIRQSPREKALAALCSRENRHRNRERT